MIKLENYTGSKSRHQCPKCGKAKAFTLYENSGKIIHSSVGRCNREIECGYHYPPKEYYENNFGSIKGNFVSLSNNFSKTKIGKLIHYIPIELFISSLNFKQNNFLEFLQNNFTSDIVKKITEQYYIGSSDRWKGATVFWQIDKNFKIRAGKIMLYDIKTCKRIKNPIKHFDWITADGGKQCFFGEHLLDGNNKTVVIVESEKSAIIGSIYFPDYLWLACGGLRMLQEEKFKILIGRKIKLIPDLRATDIWKEKAIELKKSIKGLDISVSEYLENIATDQARKDQFDIADYLLFSLRNKNDISEKQSYNLIHPNAGDNPQISLKEKNIDSNNQNKADKIKIETKQIVEKLIPGTQVKNPNKTVKTKICDDLIRFFETVELPQVPYKFDRCNTINDLRLFIRSHIETIQYNSEGYYSCDPYARRLKILRDQLKKEL